MSRYQFLAALHAVLQPKTYLDIGVQNGHSLRLIGPETVGLGVDPHPTAEAYRNTLGKNVEIFPVTSDEFFRQVTPTQCSPIDFASIDGMHLFEYVLRDFIGCEALASPTGVVAFDDVSPYSSLIATRVQPPGDWTGDVWKIRPILDEHRPDLTTVLVDTFPTGTLLAWGLDPTSTVLRERYEVIEAEWLAAGEEVPAEILRNRGVTAEVALEMIKRREA
jgi:hypothetical protein